MKHKARTPAYPGELGKPMAPIYFGLLSPDGIETAKKQRSEEIMRRMELLAAHFGHGPENPARWFAVALSLALAHVPGLAIDDPNKKAGAEKVWDTSRLGLLVFEMEREKASGIPIKKAAHILSMRRPWTKLVKGSVDRAEALRAMYTRARRMPGVTVSRRAWEAIGRYYLVNHSVDAWIESQRVVESDNHKIYV